MIGKPKDGIADWLSGSRELLDGDTPTPSDLLRLQTVTAAGLLDHPALRNGMFPERRQRVIGIASRVARNFGEGPHGFQLFQNDSRSDERAFLRYLDAAFQYATLGRPGVRLRGFKARHGSQLCC